MYMQAGQFPKRKNNGFAATQPGKPGLAGLIVQKIKPVGTDRFKELLFNPTPAPAGLAAEFE